MKGIKEKVFNDKSFFVIGFLALLGSALSKYLNISTLFLLISSVTVVVFLFAFQFKSKFKFLLISVAVFFAFHLIIFPSIYVLILNSDPESIVFDSHVQAVEKKSSLKKLNRDFNPNLRASVIKRLDSLLADNDPKLELNLSSFNSGDILKLKNYLIYTHSEIVPMGRSNFVTREYLAICDKDGKHIFTLANDTIDFYSSSIKIRELIIETQKREVENYKIFETDTENIEEVKEFWNFNRIIPYSINIFNTDIIKPKSGLANIVFAIHRFVVFGIIFTIIGSLLPGFLIRKKE